MCITFNENRSVTLAFISRSYSAYYVFNSDCTLLQHSLCSDISLSQLFLSYHTINYTNSIVLSCYFCLIKLHKKVIPLLLKKKKKMVLIQHKQQSDCLSISYFFHDKRNSFLRYDRTILCTIDGIIN